MLILILDTIVSIDDTKLESLLRDIMSECPEFNLTIQNLPPLTGEGTISDPPMHRHLIDFLKNISSTMKEALKKLIYYVDTRRMLSTMKLGILKIQEANAKGEVFTVDKIKKFESIATEFTNRFVQYLLTTAIHSRVTGKRRNLVYTTSGLIRL